jgi:hypothetical protein
VVPVLGESIWLETNGRFSGKSWQSNYSAPPVTSSFESRSSVRGRSRAKASCPVAELFRPGSTFLKAGSPGQRSRVRFTAISGPSASFFSVDGTVLVAAVGGATAPSAGVAATTAAVSCPLVAGSGTTRAPIRSRWITAELNAAAGLAGRARIFHHGRTSTCQGDGDSQTHPQPQERPQSLGHSPLLLQGWNFSRTGFADLARS